jgi:hypothetical protein
MQKLKNKSMSILIATLLLISIGASTLLISPTNAHTPGWQMPTYSFLSVSPNPVGVGQTANVNFWLSLAPPTASGPYGDRWKNITVVVTKPDGHIDTLGPFTTDDTGGTFTTFTPTAIGNYTFQMVFGGEILANANPNPNSATNAYVGDYFQPSKSNVVHLIVQQDQITYPGAVPLPTNYWERPIYGENNNWNTIAGNWLGLGISTFANTGMYNSSANYNPYTTAPNTAHILWTRPVAFGGIMGGEFGNSETSNYYSTSQYEPKFAPIIINGILYYTEYPGSNQNPSGIIAVDLHTGQKIWEIKDLNSTLPASLQQPTSGGSVTSSSLPPYTTALRCGQILNYVSPNQFGGIAYLWLNIPTVAPNTGTTYAMYDAMTGTYILRIVNGTAMTLVEGDHGELIGYYVNSTVPSAPTLSMWNSTEAILYPNGHGQNFDQWYWRPVTGSTLSFHRGIMWTKPLPINYTGNPLPGTLAINGINSGVVLLSVYTSVGATQYQSGAIIEAGYDALTGQQLWIVNRTQTIASRVLFGATTMGSGVYVEFDQATLTSKGFNLKTGTQMWGPISLPNISPYSSLGQQYIVANGIIYDWTYGGDIYAQDMQTGQVLWEYHSRAADLESPYGIWPLWTFTVGTVADGKLFVPEGHMYSPPLFHEAQQLAINLTTGKLVWSIDAFDVTSAPAISDGVMTTLNAYDNQIYAYGKGPTAMSVTAPKTAIELGKSLVIEGSVLDISAGSQQQAVAANFPNGLPAVSDASMTSWMKYIYMQQQLPTDTVGVPVSVSVVDSNGNFRQIGTTTSDASGKFGLQWTPDITGKYTVIATFGGSESYYGSSAETFFAVDEAAATPAPTATPIQSAADVYFVPAIAGLFVLIIIVAIVLAMLMMRKRP